MFVYKFIIKFDHEDQSKYERLEDTDSSLPGGAGSPSQASYPHFP